MCPTSSREHQRLYNHDYYYYYYYHHYLWPLPERGENCCGENCHVMLRRKLSCGWKSVFQGVLFQLFFTYLHFMRQTYMYCEDCTTQVKEKKKHAWRECAPAQNTRGHRTASTASTRGAWIRQETWTVGRVDCGMIHLKHKHGQRPEQTSRRANIHAYVRCQLATGIAHIQLWLQWLWNQQLCVPCKCLCENELHSCQACSSARRIELRGRHQRVQLTRTCSSGSSFDTHKLVFCDDAPRVCTMVDNVNQLGKIGAKSVTHEHETSTLAKCLASHILIKKYLIKMQTTLACSVVKCW